VLRGRDTEQQAIASVMAQARAGQSAVLALLGDAGIGKTALLDFAASAAQEMQVLRARGLQSEAEIPFSGLLELLRPALSVLHRIPRPHAEALEAAFALRPGAARERFAIGAATLSLLAAQAEDGPVAILIDDAHWLDASSATALRFAIRRLIADPIAVLVAARTGEPSLLDDAGLPSLQLEGLDLVAATALLAELPAAVARRLHEATAGNPLALRELAGAGPDLDLPARGPLLVTARVARAYVGRIRALDHGARQVLLLAATDDSGELAILERAASALPADIGDLAAAEAAGLVTLRPGSVAFHHPLARSAVYSDAPPQDRRDCHRALAGVLPDRDVDRRAWHLAAAAVGTDAPAAAALEQAARRSLDRSAYAAAAAGFQRAGDLSAAEEQRARLLAEAAEAAWLAGQADRATALLPRVRALSTDPSRLLAADELAGRIATRRGPVMGGQALLAAAAERASPETAVALLAEAAHACLYAGDAQAMLAAAQRAQQLLPADAMPATRFLALTAIGMARIFGGDGTTGAGAIREAIALAEHAGDLHRDPRLLPWLAVAPIFLREAGAGRALLEHALGAARERAAVAALPFLLFLVARDHATTDRWSQAESTYREAIELARESGQRTDLALSLAGLAWLQARRGRDALCREAAGEALALSGELGTRLGEIWAMAALGELASMRGVPERALEHLSALEQTLGELSIVDADLSPAPELIEAHLRLGDAATAAVIAERHAAAARAKAQPWSLARAERGRGLVAPETEMGAHFTAALAHHSHTPDAFERARTQLAYGERLRRARERVAARVQLREALATFERLDAPVWADRARAELAATGERTRRRDPSTLDELTAQELQIGLLLAAGRTTREAAAALFLSPKTIEYHLRHVYQKLSIHSREELARALGRSADQAAAGS
jgi:DNA-binding CsgD family transcriptional regulator